MEILFYLQLGLGCFIFFAINSKKPAKIKSFYYVSSVYIEFMYKVNTFLILFNLSCSGFVPPSKFLQEDQLTGKMQMGL